MSSRDTGTPTERHATVVQNAEQSEVPKAKHIGAGWADQKSVGHRFPIFHDAHV